MSEHVWPVLAVIPAEFGDAIEVAHDPASREMRIGIIRRGEEEAQAWLSSSARDELRELLDRAAMPGQDEAHAAVPHIVTNQDSHLRHGCPTCLTAEAHAAQAGDSRE